MSLFTRIPRATLVSLASVTAALVTATVAVAAINPSAPADSLEKSVASAMTASKGATAQAYFEFDQEAQPLVEPKRSAGAWSFGTTVIPIPGNARQKHGTPENAIFLARNTGRTWQVALHGTPQFRALVKEAPVSVVSAEEKDLFTKVADTSAANTGLALPWSQNGSWGWGGGPHGYSGSNRPFSSIDFGGNSQSVLSPAAGRVYKSCVKNGSALVTVVHTSGYSTSYYHMTNLTTLADGASVQLGTRLGTTGTALPCGGSANGAHVHFTLLSGSSYVAVNGKTIGGWTFYEGSQAYQGYAQRGSTRSYPGSGRLTNYGVS